MWTSGATDSDEEDVRMSSDSELGEFLSDDTDSELLPEEKTEQEQAKKFVEQTYEGTKYVPELVDDIWSSAWLSSALHPLADCRNIVPALMVVIVAVVQAVIPLAMAFTLVKQRRVAYNAMKEEYQEMHETVGSGLNFGRNRLAGNMAESFCGKFLDDYHSGPSSSQEVVYSKYPIRSWQVLSLVPETRSVLDETLFVLAPFSFFSITMVLLGCLWMLKLLVEYLEIREFYIVVTNLSSRKCSKRPQFVRGIRRDTKGDSDDDTLEIVAAPCRSRWVGLSIVVARIIIMWLVGISGCILLVTTRSIIELILNSLSLAFILEIDEVIAATVLPRHARILSKATTITKMKIDRTWCCVKVPLNLWRVGEDLKPILSIVACCLVGGFLRWVQIEFVREKFNLVAPMCLFFGSTPDRQVQYDTVFPVVGFCESLLQTRCAVPQHWRSAQCTLHFTGLKEAAHSSSTFSKARCREYDSMGLSGSSWTQWLASANESDYCVSTYFTRQKTMFERLIAGEIFGSKHPSQHLATRPISELNGNLNSWAEWIEEVDTLRRACLSMWQKAPAMKELPVENRSNTPAPNKLAPKDDPLSIIPFPRMRDVELSEDAFAGPFACGWNDIIMKVVKDFSGPSEEGPKYLGSAEMQDALSNCSKTLPTVYTGGHSGSKCSLHVHCIYGFCDQTKHCSDHGCEDCKKCSDGYGGYCGKQCQIEEGLNCTLPGKPSLAEEHKVDWTVDVDWAREKWFVYNKATGQSVWDPPANILSTHGQVPVFTQIKQTKCGSGSICPRGNSLYIGANGERWDIATRQTARTNCGPRCWAVPECEGFSFNEHYQRCYYRKNTTCSRAVSVYEDCYVK